MKRNRKLKGPSLDKLCSWINTMMHTPFLSELREEFYKVIRTTSDDQPFPDPREKLDIELVERNNALVHALVCTYVREFKFGFEPLDTLPPQERISKIKKYLSTKFSGEVDLDELFGKKLENQASAFHRAMVDIMGKIHKALLTLKEENIFGGG